VDVKIDFGEGVEVRNPGEQDSVRVRGEVRENVVPDPETNWN